MIPLELRVIPDREDKELVQVHYYAKETHPPKEEEFIETAIHQEEVHLLDEPAPAIHTIQNIIASEHNLAISEHSNQILP